MLSVVNPTHPEEDQMAKTTMCNLYDHETARLEMQRADSTH